MTNTNKFFCGRLCLIYYINYSFLTFRPPLLDESTKKCTIVQHEYK